MNSAILGTIGIETIKTKADYSGVVLGGTGYYGASAMRSLGGQAYLASCIGKDYANLILNSLSWKGIDDSLITIAERGRTMFWNADYSNSYDTAITIDIHDDLLIAPTIDLNKLAEKSSDIDGLYLGGYNPTTQLDVLSILRNSICVAETNSYWISIDKNKVEEVFAKSDVVVVSIAEANKLWNVPDISERNYQVLRKLCQETEIDILIITDGSNGALAISRSFIINIPALLVPVVDTTGAGNVFGASLLQRLLSLGKSKFSDNEIISALCFSSVIAAKQVTNFSDTALAQLNVHECEEQAKGLFDAIGIS